MVVTKKTFQAGIEINHQRKNLESRKKETAKKRKEKEIVSQWAKKACLNYRARIIKRATLKK